MRQVRDVSAGLVSFGAWNAASPGKGRKEGRKDGRKDGRKNGREGRKEGRKERKEERRKGVGLEQKKPPRGVGAAGIKRANNYSFIVCFPRSDTSSIEYVVH